MAPPVVLLPPLRRRLTPELVVTSKSDAYLTLAASAAPFGLALFMLGAIAGVPVMSYLAVGTAVAGLVASWTMMFRLWPRVEITRRGLLPDMYLRVDLHRVLMRWDVVRRAVAVSRGP